MNPVKVLFGASLCCLVLRSTAAKKRQVVGSDKPEDLSEAESQASYGYGYGTKVQDEYSVATVYVHGFGTSDYEDPYAHNDLYVPPHKVLPKEKVPPPPPTPKVPVYRPPEPEPEVIK